MIALTPVGGPASWRRADLEDDSSWWHRFDEAEIAELDAALATLRAAHPDLDLRQVTTADFPLPTLGGELGRLRRRLIEGRGVMVYDGVPVDRYGTEELRAIWWGISLHLGTPVPQSWRGDMIGDVRDIGTGIDGKAGRGYTSNVELNFHSDAADASGLFFLRQGATGGVTRLASSVAVHDEILRRRPDLLEVLYRPFTVSWQSNEPPGARPWYELPVYGRVGGDLACAFVRTNILRAEQNCGAPPLTAEQVEAVELVAAVAAEPGMWVERTLPAGAMLFVNNHTVFHMRTAFTDHPDPAPKRHLLRVFLSLPNGRALPDSFATFFGDIRAGAVRGGYPSRTPEPRFTTI